MHINNNRRVFDAHEMIAQRAQQAVGVRFRLHGRSIETGLDCVGLIAYAIKPLIKNIDVPEHYQLRFDNIETPRMFFAQTNFAEIDTDIAHQCGDIILTAPACQQLHFLILHHDHYVHAHSGLRRIVAANYPLTSAAIMAWRYKGE